MGERKDARGTACGSRSSRAKRLVGSVGLDGSFACRFGGGCDGSGVCRGAGIWLFIDAYQILVRDFPAKMLVLSPLLEVLFEEDGTAGIGYENA